MYSYRAYNSNLISNISLNGFDLPILGPQQFDLGNDESIKFFFKKCSESNIEFYNNQTKLDSDYGFFYSKNTALFEFFSGNSICINYFNEITPKLIYTTLNYPVSCIFMQRNKIALHASAIEFKNKTFLFPGISSSGKSSLAAVLLKNGGKLISEDSSILDFEEVGPRILPSYPFIKISDELNSILNLCKETSERFIQSERNRRGYVINENLYQSNPKKIDYVIFPIWSKNDYLMEELTHREALKNIVGASLRPPKLMIIMLL